MEKGSLTTHYITNRISVGPNGFVGAMLRKTHYVFVDIFVTQVTDEVDPVAHPIFRMLFFLDWLSLNVITDPETDGLRHKDEQENRPQEHHNGNARIPVWGKIDEAG